MVVYLFQDDSDECVLGTATIMEVAASNLGMIIGIVVTLLIIAILILGSVGLLYNRRYDIALPWLP